MTDKDATTEAELRAIFSHLDPVPPLLDEAARGAFTWRTVDAELAELMRDSAEAEEEAGALVRGAAGPRQLSFESPRLGIELEVVATGPRERRLEGQLLPPASGHRDDRAAGRGRAVGAGRRARALLARRPEGGRGAAARGAARRADRDPLDDHLKAGHPLRPTPIIRILDLGLQLVHQHREREVGLRRRR